jgi:diaminohydroxyphosphoribosylaminopyrimidine deaminase/5-amino-6-(5-phosphoribosylamino)uracil reductase
VGVCEAEARQLNEAFGKYVTTGIPFVTLKCAMSLDGKIATRTGASQWITSPAARLEGHRLRHASDAVLVGLGTVLSDDPLLTTRLPDRPGVNALRVIVDSTLRVPRQAQVTDVASDRRTLIVTTARAPVARREALQVRGVEVVHLPAYDDGRVDLEALLRYLGERGVASVLVEGGATLSATLLRRRLVDKVLLFVAPKIIGADGISVVGPCGVETMEQVINLRDVVSQRLGNDVLLEAYCTTEVVSS